MVNCTGPRWSLAGLAAVTSKQIRPVAPHLLTHVDP